MLKGPVVHRGVIDWSGSPGGPSVNGTVGEPGVNGAPSTDSSPGKEYVYLGAHNLRNKSWKLSEPSFPALDALIAMLTPFISIVYRSGESGKPGFPGVAGQAGAPGRDIYLVLNEAIDEQHVRVKIDQQETEYALPLLVRSNGGVGAAGGNGGVGGAYLFKRRLERVERNGISWPS